MQHEIKLKAKCIENRKCTIKQIKNKLVGISVNLKELKKIGQIKLYGHRGRKHSSYTLREENKAKVDQSETKKESEESWMKIIFTNGLCICMGQSE